MALVGYELLVIAGIAVILLLWGPKKIPEIAKAVGEAKRAFREGQEEKPEPAPKA